MNKYIIGIGSQRAGSTLLHKIISSSTPAFMHPIKELHYFDTLFGVRNQSTLREFNSRLYNDLINTIIHSDENFDLNKEFKCQLRAAKKLASDELSSFDYEDLYRPCLQDNEFVGEITPEYMILSESAVSQLAASVGSDAKIILLSRNPVDRFISAFKLLKVYGGKEYDFSNFTGDMKLAFREMPTWMDQQDKLNDYKSALDLYEKYFDQVLFVSFEKMIGNPEKFYSILSQYLGIPIDRERYDSCFVGKVNQIGESKEVDKAIIDFLLDRYTDQIKFLKSKGHLE